MTYERIGGVHHDGVAPPRIIPRMESCTITSVIGTYIIVAVLLLFPVGFLMSTTIAAGVIGWALQSNAESANQDSELVECNY